MTFLQAIVIGFIQGVAELFPISSLGHTVILPKLRATARTDQVEFHWSFLPLANPHHTGGGLRLGARPDGGPQVAPVG